ncbi:unnamed protein product [Parnassius mnemosyne]|uniref:Uncharacterized protein n=1 Tax=Parnassius mnemosyne TaxID=213953 RepID=A0AAV1KXM7_9NEOP
MYARLLLLFKKKNNLFLVIFVPLTIWRLLQVFTLAIIETSLNSCRLIVIMKSISFFVEPSGYGKKWKKEFIIKSPSFSMKSASCWPLEFLCPIPNFHTFSSPFSLVPVFVLKSPINTV